MAMRQQPYVGISTSGVGHLEPSYTPGFAVVTFVWKTEHGHCQDCGLPAAFYLPFAYVKASEGGQPEPPLDHNKRCAICAANAACEGETVERIEKEY